MLSLGGFGPFTVWRFYVSGGVLFFLGGGGGVVGPFETKFGAFFEDWGGRICEASRAEVHSRALWMAV